MSVHRFVEDPKARRRVDDRIRAKLALAIALLAVFTSTVSANPPAFPGAEGFGAQASGGRGGQVIYVTTLAPSGPGSLQAALDTPGPRYILFRVSGVIPAAAHLTYDDVTIAGQTSPGGIIIRGFHTTEVPYCDQNPSCIGTARTAENWILRHVRLRPGTGPDAFDDGLRLLHTKRAIVDHVSIANATDEAVQISYSSDITIQYSIIAETVGSHAQYGGVLLNYSHPNVGWPLTRISLHHNVWNRIEGRLPEVSCESPEAAGSTIELELSNNLLWDPGYHIDMTNGTFPYEPWNQPVFYRFNWVGNYAQVRSNFPYGLIDFRDPLVAGQTTTYFHDNRLSRYPGWTDYQLNYCCNDYPPNPLPGVPAYAVSARHPFPAITYHPSASLTGLLYARAGARPRDPMDRRLMAPLASGTIDPTPRHLNPYGDAFLLDFPAGSPPAPPQDSDLDGMPDEWELAHGLDPNVQDHNGTELSVPLTGVAGYTNLECYLHQLAARLESDLFRNGFES